MGVTISIPDTLRQSVEAASGGRNTVLYDEKGYPSVMVVIPAFNIQDIMGDSSLGTGLHPAFDLGGTPKRELFIGKYLASIFDNTAVSLPGRDPAASINFDNSRARCAAKGNGWHLMTNAEWSAVAMWSHKLGFEARGNTNLGRDYSAVHETGRRQDSLAPGAAGTARTLTGSGPATWSHDGTESGIMDLCGNVWEWVGGLRLVGGEIQVIYGNNAAYTSQDMSNTSPDWFALLPDGSHVAPGTGGTLKYDASGANGTGNPILSNVVTSVSDGTTSANRKYNTMTATVSVPPIAKLLGLYPHVTTMARGNLYMQNLTERLPFRGGSWNNGSFAGLFALYLNNARSDTLTNVGFRPAFLL